MAEHLENVALIGASGNLGKATLNALLKEIKHNITIITRPSSTADYPSHVKVRKGQYSDAAFLESALKDHDVLVIMLGFSGLSDQDTIIRAAGRAGVKYVLPTEYGVSSGNEKQVKAIPMLQAKRDVHNQIEGLGMRWIAVVTNLWIDYVGIEASYCYRILLLTSARSVLSMASSTFTFPREGQLCTLTAHLSSPQLSIA